MNLAEKIRAFVAIHPPVDWQTLLGELQGRLKTRIDSTAFRWAAPVQMHLTLRFLGSITLDEATRAGDALERFRSEPALELVPGALGCFPNEQRPRVLWLGLAGETQGLLHLQRHLTQVTAALGEPPETREFKPHLTLARIREIEPQGNVALREALKKEPAAFSVPPWRVAQISLMRSRLSPQGARYEVIHSVPLSGVKT